MTTLIEVLDLTDEGYQAEFMRWVRYFFACEEYDRQVCSGWHPKRMCAWPMNAHELGLITIHSRKLLAQMGPCRDPKAKSEAAQLQHEEHRYLIDQVDRA